jgi:hypothetical protein
MFGNREQLREQFINAWEKFRNRAPLEGVEAALAEVIREHPEYHSLLDDRDRALTAEFPPEIGQSNPFMHMAMHLSIREQTAIDRPPGIRAIHRRLSARHGALEAEHRMLECLAEVLWDSQRRGTEPDTAVYVDCLQRLNGTPST